MPQRRRTHTRHEVVRTAFDQRVWSPAQVVGGLIGLAMIVFGGVAMARTGMTSLTGQTAQVAGISQTTLMALFDVLVGIMFLGASADAIDTRGSMSGLGLALIAFGAVLAIEPTTFNNALGNAREISWLLLGAGAVSVVAAWASPVIVSDRRRMDEGYVDGSHDHVSNEEERLEATHAVPESPTEPKNEETTGYRDSYRR